MLESIIFVLGLLLIPFEAGEDRHDDCGWFGYYIDTPIFPMWICSTYVNEGEMDGLYKYSTKYECERGDKTVSILEYNDTDCSGEPYAVTTYDEDSGMYWNCPEYKMSCPYVKIKLYQLYNDSNDDHNGDGHLCTIDTNNYEEISIVTDYCMDFSGAFGEDFSYYVDCTASSVEFTSYTDDSCSVQDNSSIITEGCDDPFNWDAYVQIAECRDDGQIIDSNTLAPTSSPSDSSDSTTIIIVIAIAVIIIVAAILIGAFIVRNKRMGGGVGSVNNASIVQPMQFDRLADENTDE